MTELGTLEPYQIVFPRLGIDITVKSVAFTIFGMQITWYGIIIAFGMLLAMVYAFSHMKRHGLDPDRAFDVVIGGFFGGLIGARAYYVIFNWDEYAGDWRSIFNTRGGGLAIYGGIIGALLVGILICRLRKVKVLPMLDIASLGFLIGQGIGRWGNFTNHEAFGTNTDGLFGMSSGTIQNTIVRMMSASDSTLVGKGIELSDKYPVHPCFLYESVWCLVGFVLLAIVARKFRKFDGQIFLGYVAWYGLGRFFIEGLRTDSLYIGKIRVSQALAAVCCVAGAVLLAVFFTKVKRMGSDYVLYCDTEESKQLLREAQERMENGGKKKEETPAEPILEQEETTTDENANTPEPDAQQPEDENKEEQ